MKKQMEVMLKLQDAMNTTVNAEWRDQEYEWYRAIWSECGELIDHYGFKWWKKQEPDLEQTRLEVVDIWHFGLSIYLLNGSEYDIIAEDIGSLVSEWRGSKVDVRLAAEQVAADALNEHTMFIDAFMTLLTSVDMTFDDLFRMYVGKNVLNMFRQRNGYKDGSYVKVWASKEDNVYLSDIIGSTTVTDDFFDVVYNKLDETYKTVCK